MPYIIIYFTIILMMKTTNNYLLSYDKISYPYIYENLKSHGTNYIYSDHYDCYFFTSLWIRQTVDMV